MSEKKVDPDLKPRFDYIVFLDIVVLACIVVIAGRPDGLAITVSAVIVAALALLYRCVVGVKTYMSDGVRRRAAPAPKREAAPKPPAPPPVGSTASRGSWLRDAD